MNFKEETATYRFFVAALTAGAIHIASALIALVEIRFGKSHSLDLGFGVLIIGTVVILGFSAAQLSAVSDGPSGEHAGCCARHYLKDWSSRGTRFPPARSLPAGRHRFAVAPISKPRQTGQVWRGFFYSIYNLTTGGQHDLIPDASPPPTNKAVVTGGAGTISRWQVAPGRTRALHPKDAIEHTSIIYARNAARLVRQHQLDRGPFIIAEFVAHDSRLRFGELESRLRPHHQPATAQGGAANALNLLPLSAAQRT